MARICKEDGRSITQFASMAVAGKVSAMKTTEFVAAHAADADIDAALRLLHRDGRTPSGFLDRLEDDSRTSPDPQISPVPSV